MLKVQRRLGHGIHSMSVVTTAGATGKRAGGGGLPTSPTPATHKVSTRPRRAAWLGLGSGSGFAGFAGLGFGFGLGPHPKPDQARCLQ